MVAQGEGIPSTDDLLKLGGVPIAMLDQSCLDRDFAMLVQNVGWFGSSVSHEQNTRGPGAMFFPQILDQPLRNKLLVGGLKHEWIIFPKSWDDAPI